ncbi:MAG: cupin domain-containing protein [Gammaproteobacteria bacterium]|nr:cupin domain-containing protein [Gammaproteobacteria bacterium]
MSFENLLTTELMGAAGTEVVVSRVTVPAHASLPRHWHPGEEFAYMLEGSLTLLQDGKDDENYKQGEVGVVPFKQVHTIQAGEEGCSILVFRVHEQGEPERTLVE